MLPRTATGAEAGTSSQSSHQHAPQSGRGLGCPARQHNLQRSVRRRRCQPVIRLQVTCTALEERLDVPSTSGRTNGMSIPAMFDGTELLMQPDLLAEEPQLHSDAVEETPQKQNSNNIKMATTLPLMFELIQRDGDQFNAQNTSHAMHSLAKLYRAYFTSLHAAQLTSKQSREEAYKSYVQPALLMLNKLVLRDMDDMDPWGVSMCVWAYGTLEHADDFILDALCRRAMELMEAFRAIDCATMLMGFAKMRYRPRGDGRELMEHLVEHTLHLLQDDGSSWQSRDLGNIAWALGKLYHSPGHVFMEALMDVVLFKIDDFSLQELCNVMWGYARLDWHMPRAFARICRFFDQHLTHIRPQDASNLMWALAKLNFKPRPPLLDRLPSHIELSEFKPQEVCNLLYGYGQLRHHHPPLMEAAERACTPRLGAFSTQDLVLTIWAHGMVKHIPHDPALLNNACQLLAARKLMPLQIAVVIKGLAKIGFQPPEQFMRAMVESALGRLQLFKPIELCHLLWGFAHLGYRDVALFEAVVAQVQSLLTAWQRPLPQVTVSTIVYACRMVGYWPQTLIDVAEMRGIFVQQKAPPEGGYTLFINNQQPQGDAEVQGLHMPQQLQAQQQEPEDLAWQQNQQQQQQQQQQHQQEQPQQQHLQLQSHREQQQQQQQRTEQHQVRQQHEMRGTEVINTAMPHFTYRPSGRLFHN